VAWCKCGGTPQALQKYLNALEKRSAHFADGMATVATVAQANKKKSTTRKKLSKQSGMAQMPPICKIESIWGRQNKHVKKDTKNQLSSCVHGGDCARNAKYKDQLTVQLAWQPLLQWLKQTRRKLNLKKLKQLAQEQKIAKTTINLCGWHGANTFHSHNSINLGEEK